MCNFCVLPVKAVPEMTYPVLDGTYSLTSTHYICQFFWPVACMQMSKTHSVVYSDCHIMTITSNAVWIAQTCCHFGNQSALIQYNLLQHTCKLLETKKKITNDGGPKGWKRRPKGPISYNPARGSVSSVFIYIIVLSSWHSIGDIQECKVKRGKIKLR